MMIGWFWLVGWEVIRGGELLTSGRQSPALTSNKGQFLQSFANNPPSEPGCSDAKQSQNNALNQLGGNWPKDIYVHFSAIENWNKSNMNLEN